MMLMKSLERRDLVNDNFVQRIQDFITIPVRNIHDLPISKYDNFPAQKNEIFQIGMKS